MMDLARRRRDAARRFHEEAELVHHSPIAHPHHRNLDHLGTRAVLVGGLEVQGGEIPKASAYVADLDELRCLEDAKRDTHGGRNVGTQELGVSRLLAAQVDTADSDSAQNPLEGDLDATHARNPDRATAVANRPQTIRERHDVGKTGGIRERLIALLEDGPKSADAPGQEILHESRNAGVTLAERGKIPEIVERAADVSPPRVRLPQCLFPPA